MNTIKEELERIYFKEHYNDAPLEFVDNIMEFMCDREARLIYDKENSFYETNPTIEREHGAIYIAATEMKNRGDFTQVQIDKAISKL